ncbi:MAG TPA: NAD-dependent epimerase/dehydratase family protein [Solirubrobacterales bacterium]|nr:NAD-dependent epimerase/dehydratase family protein [Solirubrobacterales bacterium]
MRVFLAGASGAIGRQLVPLLVAAGHEVAGTTRSEAKVEMLRELGAEPVLLDVYDAEQLREAAIAFGPEVVIHQLTDLPSDPARISEKAADNARVRTEGTCNLIAAAQAAEAPRFLAQSIAWRLPGDAHDPVDEHERMVLHAGGVILRYGRFYGPGTYHEHDLPEPPYVHVAEAARRTVELLEAPSGVVEIVED